MKRNLDDISSLKTIDAYFIGTLGEKRVEDIKDEIKNAIIEQFYSALEEYYIFDTDTLSEFAKEVLEEALCNIKEEMVEKAKKELQEKINRLEME